MDDGYVRRRQIWNSVSESSFRLMKNLKMSSAELEGMRREASLRPISSDELKPRTSGRNVEK